METHSAYLGLCQICYCLTHQNKSYGHTQSQSGRISPKDTERQKNTGAIITTNPPETYFSVFTFLI